MESIFIDGVVINKTAPISYTGQNNVMHNQCEILLETQQEEFPQRLAVRLVDDKCANAPELYQRVRCYLRFRVGNGNTGKWFNDIKAWKVEVLS